MSAWHYYRQEISQSLHVLCSPEKSNSLAKVILSLPKYAPLPSCLRTWGFLSTPHGNPESSFLPFFLLACLPLFFSLPHTHRGVQIFWNGVSMMILSTTIWNVPSFSENHHWLERTYSWQIVISMLCCMKPAPVRDTQVWLVKSCISLSFYILDQMVTGSSHSVTWIRLHEGQEWKAGYYHVT